jgi:hypothetical protein
MAKKPASKGGGKSKGPSATDHRKLAAEHSAKARLHSAKAELMDAKNPPKNKPVRDFY